MVIISQNITLSHSEQDTAIKMYILLTVSLRKLLNIICKALTSPESLLLRSGITRVFLLLPGAIVEPILILGPTNMYRLSPDLYWML